MTRRDERIIACFRGFKTDAERIAFIIALELAGENIVAEDCKRIYTGSDAE